MLYSMLASKKSLFEELWEYFADTYFSNDLPYLENFTVRGNQIIFYKLIIVGLCLGLIFAAVCNLYNKRYVGNFVRKIIMEDCMCPKNAKTLDELGYSRSFGVHWVIRSGGSLSRWVRCVEEDEFYAELEKKREELDAKYADAKIKPKFVEPKFKRNLKTMRFYIPEDKKYSAEIKFDPKGVHVLGVVFVAVVSLILCLLLCYILSDIIKLFDNFISVINK